MTYVHPTSTIGQNVILGKNIYIGPHCIIGFPTYNEPIEYLQNQEFKKTIIGDGTRILGHSVVCENSSLGKNCNLDYFTYVGSDTKIGTNVNLKYGAKIYSRVLIGNYNSISGFIANDCIIGNNSVIQGNLIHIFKDVNYGTPEPAPKIEDNVFIGMNAMIIGGIIIKERCYIGSCAVVTKTTEKGKLYVGNPAIEKGDAPNPYKISPWKKNTTANKG